MDKVSVVIVGVCCGPITTTMLRKQAEDLVSSFSNIATNKMVINMGNFAIDLSKIISISYGDINTSANQLSTRDKLFTRMVRAFEKSLDDGDEWKG